MTVPPPGRLAGGFQPWADVWWRSGWRVQRHSRTGAARLLGPSGTAVLKPGDAAEDECIAAAAGLAPSARRKAAAVLVHGLAHHPGAMRQAAAALTASGWAVASPAYPSVWLPLATHAESVSRIARCLADDGASEVCLVGHSLGGLIIRAAAARAATDGWSPGRIVLIGSPSQGAQIAQALSGLALYRRLLGPCAVSVAPPQAAEIPFPACRGYAVIAGGNGRRGYNPLLEGDNDGVVRVAETRIAGEGGFLLVPAFHTPLAGRPEAVAASVRFLSGGRVAA